MDFDKEIGLRKGMLYDEVKANCSSITPQYIPEWYNIYPLKYSMPYIRYACKIDNIQGLTRICGWTDFVECRNSGEELTSLFEYMLQQNEYRYGKYKIIDTLSPGARYTADYEYMLSLLNNERILMAVFSAETGSKLPENIICIQIQAYANTEYSGNIMVRYFFNNDSEMMLVLKKTVNL